MIHGIGVDLIEIKRIKRAKERFGKTFLNRVFTDEEIKYCQAHSKAEDQHFAGRFAAKEAVLKALGTGWPFVSLKDVEIIKDSVTGAPEVVLYGNILGIANRFRVSSILLSISHTKEYAIAQAICNVGDKL
jgi:phosphopantetheine--protein transferase-like protein